MSDVEELLPSEHLSIMVLKQKVDLFFKTLSELQRDYSAKLESRNFINVLEVYSIFKILILLTDIDLLLPVTEETDQQLFFVIFEKVSTELLLCLGFTTENAVNSTSIR